MSFFTSLSFYRPCSPPVITVEDLANFITRIRDTGTLTDSGYQDLRVAFGNQIDQDLKDVIWTEQVAPLVRVVHDIEWDIESDMSSIQEMIDCLSSDKRHVYRASIDFGEPIDQVLAPITRTNSPENESDYCPDSLSLEIGPVRCHSLASDDEPVLTGWISLDLSGYGYLYPWTFRDVVERLEKTPEVKRLTKVCREFWPVPSKRPERRFIEARNKHKDLWPYDDFDRPWDWYWGVSESG